MKVYLSILIILLPIIVASSQSISQQKRIEELNEKIERNENLRMKVASNDLEIKYLLQKLFDIRKSPETGKRKPFYQRIFVKKHKQTEIITDPIQTPLMDSTIAIKDSIDTVVKPLQPTKKRLNFFQRLFKPKIKNS